MLLSRSESFPPLSGNSRQVNFPCRRFYRTYGTLRLSAHSVTCQTGYARLRPKVGLNKELQDTDTRQI